MLNHILQGKFYDAPGDGAGVPVTQKPAGPTSTTVPKDGDTPKDPEQNKIPAKDQRKIRQDAINQFKNSDEFKQLMADTIAEGEKRAKMSADEKAEADRKEQEANYGAARWYASDWWQYTDHYYSTSLRKGVDGNHIMKGTIFKSDASKFTVGGRKIGEQVRVTPGAKFYGTSTTIAKSMTTKNLTIKQVKAANVGKSKQVVLVYNGDAVIGWLRDQDVTAYYHSATVKKLKVTAKSGIYTYLHGKRAQ